MDTMEKQTTLDDVLLDVLRTNGGWMTRSDIARALQRPGDRLNYYDIERLNDLAEREFIQLGVRQIGVAKTRFEYRMRGA